MSRTGKLPVVLSDKVKASVVSNVVTIEGPKGKLTRSFNAAAKITLSDGEIHVHPADSSRLAQMMHGTARSIIQSMVQGVMTPYSKSIEIQGTGFKAVLKGQTLDLSLGYSHPIIYKIPAGVNVNVTDGGTKMTIEGPDKCVVGQVAADIKHFYPVEPYKGKGVRIVGEFVRRKEGKKTA